MHRKGSASPLRTVTSTPQTVIPAAVGVSGASRRPFRRVHVVVFDWDGTAVPNRQADARAARERIERLSALGVDVVIVTGTSVGNVDGQLSARPEGPGRLFACTNRGSEVFAITATGPELVWSRKATPAEDAALSVAAESLRDGLARRGLGAAIIYDRLNRRKVDLIPDWVDPPKSEMPDLLRRVEGRLAAAGIGGLADVLDLAEQTAKDAGLPEARITSDVKHVEIGLTDKADSMRWVREHLAGDDDPEGMLVAGDEFGPVGAAPGSDSRMLEAAPQAAEVVSVGPEPGGAPAGVTHLGGGPPTFLAHLDAMIAALEGPPEPVPDPSWRIEVEGIDPLREREFEAWFTVANGRTGTRGSLEEGGPASEPALYVSGLFGRDAEGPVHVELVPGPEWTHLEPRTPLEFLRPELGETLEHRRVLDLHQGMLFRTWRQRLPSGAELVFRSWRLASLADRDLLVLEAEAHLDGQAVQLAHEIPLPSPHGGLAAIAARQREGRLLIGMSATGGGSASIAISNEERDGHLQRVAAVARAGGQEPPDARAESLLEQAGELGLARLRARHRVAWRGRWRDADVVVDGDPTAQRALRFALYHLIAAGDPESGESSIGARGLTGPGYAGHVFWDTDVFVLPVLIHTHPPTARALLAYRHRTLPAARAKAARLGYRGALFAWESADTGEETSPTRGYLPDGTPVAITTGDQEHHVAADLAWATWRYWQATADEGFMVAMGAELILEAARFWTSRTDAGEDGHFHIRDVIGPDEYHEGVADNAFTNVLARFTLRCGIEASSRWRAVARRVGLRAPEVACWGRLAAGLVDGFDPATLLYEQFAGFFGLEDLCAEDVAPRPYVADAILGTERVDGAQLVKQADVVMLAHMLPEVVPREVAAANYRYYEPRTTHGSSLSPGIHAAVAARIGELGQALAYFRMAAGIDLDDLTGNSAQGVHIAALASLWHAAVLGFGGLQAHGETLCIAPRLPPEWRRLAFPLVWRGARVRVEADHERVVLQVDGSTQVAVGQNPPRPAGTGRYVATRTSEGWGEIKEVKW